MLDKLKMIQALKEKRIPVPLTYTLDKYANSLKFPCISKPRRGRGSRDVKVLNSPDELIALKSILGTFAQHTLVQEKIEGIEYTVQMVANSEKALVAVIPVKVQLKKGITLRAKTEAEGRVIAACKAIHNAIPARGTYNIQLILTSEGKVLPFEINPRISTTLCLVVAAGIDPIALYDEHTHRKELLQFTAGIHLHRHWKNVFSQREP
jgi:carbamoyl-phosphate synthase large subunit